MVLNKCVLDVLDRSTRCTESRCHLYRNDFLYTWRKTPSTDITLSLFHIGNMVHFGCLGDVFPPTRGLMVVSSGAISRGFKLFRSAC